MLFRSLGGEALERLARARVAAFFGYYVRGGALEVGKASTNAVVVSSIMILFMDVILTKLLLQ